MFQCRPIHGAWSLDSTGCSCISHPLPRRHRQRPRRHPPDHHRHAADPQAEATYGAQAQSPDHRHTRLNRHDRYRRPPHSHHRYLNSKDPVGFPRPRHLERARDLRRGHLRLHVRGETGLDHLFPPSRPHSSRARQAAIPYPGTGDTKKSSWEPPTSRVLSTQSKKEVRIEDVGMQAQNNSLRRNAYWARADADQGTSSSDSYLVRGSLLSSTYHRL